MRSILSINYPVTKGYVFLYDILSGYLMYYYMCDEFEAFITVSTY